MKYFLKITFIYLLCVGAFIILLACTQDTEFIVGRKKLYVEKSPDKNYDLLVIGSSRAEHSFNPMLYKGPLKVFNLGEEGHGLPSNYLMLKMLVEKHHLKIDKLLVQIDEFSFNGNIGFSRQFRDDFFVNDLSDPEVFQAFKMYRGTAIANILKYFPHSANIIYTDFFKFLKNEALAMKAWVPPINKVYLKNIEQAAEFKGYKPLQPSRHVRLDEQKLVIEKEDLQYFIRFMAFCKLHNISVYLYRAPIMKCEIVQSQSFDLYIENFAKSENIPFYDFKCRFQLQGGFKDQNHPADSIATLLTREILVNMNFK